MVSVCRIELASVASHYSFCSIPAPVEFSQPWQTEFSKVYHATIIFFYFHYAFRPRREQFNSIFSFWTSQKMSEDQFFQNFQVQVMKIRLFFLFSPTKYRKANLNCHNRARPGSRALRNPGFLCFC